MKCENVTCKYLQILMRSDCCSMFYCLVSFICRVKQIGLHCMWRGPQGCLKSCCGEISRMVWIGLKPVFTKMSYCISAHEKLPMLFQLHQTQTVHLQTPKEPNRVPTVLRGGHYSPGAFYTLGRMSVNDLGVSEFFLASAGHCFAALMTCLCVKGQHWKESFAREMKHWSLGWNPASLPLSWYITEWLENKFIFNIHLHEQSGYVHLLHCSGQERHSYTLRIRIILRLERFRKKITWHHHGTLSWICIARVGSTAV